MNLKKCFPAMAILPKFPQKTGTFSDENFTLIETTLPTL